MNYKLYEVGGAVRDRYLGLKSKDIDYSVVVDNLDLKPEVALDLLGIQLREEGFDVFLTEKDCFTIRAKFPEGHKHSGVADFVLARKELYYPENGRRPVSVLGTLEDDLKRRDFTVNAMAIDEDGKLVDPFGGYKDLILQSLDTPGDPWDSFREDPLRIIRGMRFAITKDLMFCKDVRTAIHEIGIKGLEVVSVERVRDELYKCFAYNTYQTLLFLDFMSSRLNFDLAGYAFKGTDLWLEPTYKKP